MTDTNISNNITENNSNITIHPPVKTEATKPASKNALFHGVYAADYVLPWESEADFEALHAELKEEWTPDGQSEKENVLALAGHYWMKRRLKLLTQMAFRRDPFLAELEKSGAQSWADVTTFVKQKETDEDSVMKLTRETLAELKAAAKASAELMTAANPESGTICYGTIVNGQCQANGYDENGNLVYKTDARGVPKTSREIQHSPYYRVLRC